MRRSSTNPERVVALLRTHAPTPLCDDCIASLAGIPNRHAVAPITLTLGLTSDFERIKAPCARCRTRKMVIAPRPGSR